MSEVPPSKSMGDPASPESKVSSPDPGVNWGKLILFGLLAGTVLATGYVFRESLTLQSLAAREYELRNLQQSHPYLFFGGAFLIYVTVAGLALPGAAALSLVYAWFFGFWPALVLISLASTLGATISFLLSRYLLRDSLQQRFGDRLASFNANLEREGAFYLFTLRLIPAIPFFIINLVMGLTPMKTVTFWWVSQIGMLPGTIVFVWAGAAVPQLSVLAERGVGGILSFEVIAAFVVLGLFPFLVKRVVASLKPKMGNSDS